MKQNSIGQKQAAEKQNSISQKQTIEKQAPIDQNLATQKLAQLKTSLAGLGSLAVAFSSGVDSTFLLKVAHEALGEHVLAITAKSSSFPKRELEESISFCKGENIRQIIFGSRELEVEGFRQNPPNRCYLCKKAFLEKVKEAATGHGIAHVAEGSNVDDEGDYRPGMTAVAELGITNPLRYARMTKEDIRRLSRMMGLSTWDKRSYACLASRFVYGEQITEEKLSMVDKAEQLLLELGFRQFRVRIHGRMARIEVEPSQFDRLMEEDVRERLVTSLKQYGFSYVTLDLQGYRTGSMNEVL